MLFVSVEAVAVPQQLAQAKAKSKAKSASKSAAKSGSKSKSKSGNKSANKSGKQNMFGMDLMGSSSQMMAEKASQAYFKKLQQEQQAKALALQRQQMVAQMGATCQAKAYEAAQNAIKRESLYEMNRMR